MLLLMPCIASVDSNAGATENEAYRVTAPEIEIRGAVFGSTEAVSSIPGPSPDVGELRRILEESGFDTAKYTDDQLEPLAKSFSGKKLVGKYQWNDPTGINWLLERAGVDTRITDILMAGEIAGVVVDGVFYAITGSMLSLGPLGIIASIAGLSVWICNDVMEANALEKANKAISLALQQKNYAVYETTVFWGLLTNGYDVEEW